MCDRISAYKRICLFLIIASILCTLTACKGGAMMTDKTGRIRLESGLFILENSKIRISIDRSAGFIGSIENLITGMDFKKEETGAWPFSIRFGENDQKCSITKNTTSEVKQYKMWADETTSYLDLYYDDIKLDWNGGSTGIKAVSHFEIGADTEYIMTSVTFDLGSASGDISSITFFEGGDLSCDPNAQRLTAPTWGGGTYWKDPVNNRDFQNGVTLGYPGKDNKTLECGWIDLHNDQNGIGIALINKKQLPAEFQIKTEQGVSVSCVMLKPVNIAGVDTPVRKGETFTTDKMIIAPHSGDWHIMADIYRAEYEKAFVTDQGVPDYLTWADISSKAKRADYMIRYFAGLDGELVTTFDDMYTRTAELIDRIGADPSGCMVWIAGQNEKGYAFNVPIMVPSYPEAGGDEALTRLSDKLHELGATVFHYEHPFAVDPEDAGYFPETDPLQHTEYWNLCTHHSVCIDNKTMQDLWSQKIIPDIRALKADGLQFDQSPLQQTICGLPGHSHGLDSVSMLSSHAKGVTALEKMVRSDLSEEAYIVSEAFNDILSRFVDIRQACWHVVPVWNGEHELCASQYTFPQYIVQSTSIINSNDGSTQSAMLFGVITGGIVCISDGATDTIRKEYIRFREDIIKAEAPGFPQGFRDDLGIINENKDLAVKVFTDGEKITLTWLSLSDIEDTQIGIDLEQLGFEGKGIRTITVDAVGWNKCGYEIIDP